jgi:PKD repeat protein
MNFARKIKVWSFIVALTLLISIPQVNAEYSNMFGPTEYTPNTYRVPKLDPFDDSYRPKQPSKSPIYSEKVNIPPVADFYITSRQNGLPRQNAGTTGTEFVFNANASKDVEDPERLEVRWDFENDGIFDLYFSRTRIVRHIFKTPGDYEVRLEVMDTAGNTSSVIKKVTVVENTPPLASFVVTPESGTPHTRFRFDTYPSQDSQFTKNSLRYHFDWNGDSIWDTPLENKTVWYHVFYQSGTYKVAMETIDPGGARAIYTQTVQVIQNTPPRATFVIRTHPSNYGTRYTFDANGSSDLETPKNRLLYRWDTNYTGPNDIVTNTNFSFSSTFSGSYDLPGPKVIRLEVKDHDGAVSYAYAKIEVTAADAFQQYLRRDYTGAYPMDRDDP